MYSHLEKSGLARHHVAGRLVFTAGLFVVCLINMIVFYSQYASAGSPAGSLGEISISAANTAFTTQLMLVSPDQKVAQNHLPVESVMPSKTDDQVSSQSDESYCVILIIDRIEGEIAIAYPDSGYGCGEFRLHFPMSLLPPGTGEGDFISLSILKDDEMTRRRRTAISGLIDSIFEQ